MSEIYFLAKYSTDKTDKDLAMVELNTKMKKLKIKDWWIKLFNNNSEQQTTVASHFGISEDEFNTKYATGKSWEEYRDEQK